MQLDEAVALAAALPDLDIAGAEVVRLQKAQPGQLFGKGKLEEIVLETMQRGAEVIIFGGDLVNGYNCDVDDFRRELRKDHPGLSSYPHPWLMPDFWQFPTVSMGLGPMMAIYQARFMRYMEHRELLPPSDRKVWCFLGDGEMDEPESQGAIALAARTTRSRAFALQRFRGNQLFACRPGPNHEAIGAWFPRSGRYRIRVHGLGPDHNLSVRNGVETEPGQFCLALVHVGHRQSLAVAVLFIDPEITLNRERAKGAGFRRRWFERQ